MFFFLNDRMSYAISHTSDVDNLTVYSVNSLKRLLFENIVFIQLFFKKQYNHSYNSISDTAKQK
jgi:hypothetical protein